MTCIVGMIDSSGDITLGGDSAGLGGLDLHLRKDKKVFRKGPFVMGFTTSFRMGQLLHHSLKVPDHTAEQDTDEFMVTTFVNAVRDCLKAGGYAKKENEVEEGGTFLVGYRGRLFIVYGDYQVAEVLSRYAAVGCGHQIAEGAMYALQGVDLSTPSKLGIALQAAENHSAGVRAPFNFVTLGRFE